MKTISPSLREKDRYVKFEVMSERPIEYSDLESAIWNTSLELYGEVGVAGLSMWVIRNMYDKKKQSGVIRCNNKSVGSVISMLGMISRLGDTRTVFKIIAISGTISGLGRSKI